MIGPLLAGAGSVDITPHEPLPLAGHANRLGPSTGVSSPLRLRALALEQDGTRAVLVSADLIWWGPERVGPLREHLGRRFGIAPELVLLHATHTHGSPQTSDRFSPSLGACDPGYQTELDQAAETAIDQALGRLTPVTVHTGRGHCDIGVHRRLLVDGQVRMMPNPHHQVDPTVRVASVRSSTGATVAALTHFACHPTTSGDTTVSADFPGAATAELEADLGGGIALFLQGCAGDVRPALVAEGRFHLGDEADAIRMGTRLALAARDGLAHSRVSPAPTPLAGGGTAVSLSSTTGHRVDLHLSWLQIAHHLRLVALDAEPVAEYSRFVTSLVPTTWPLGYTNGMLGYLPTEDQLRAGGYEPCGSVPHFRLPAPFAEGTEGRVKAALRSVVDHCEPTGIER